MRQNVPEVHIPRETKGTLEGSDGQISSRSNDPWLPKGEFSVRCGVWVGPKVAGARGWWLDAKHTGAKMCRRCT